MAAQQDTVHTYPANPVADAAWEIYETELRRRLEPEHHGKLVVIDVESHDYEIQGEGGGAWVRLTDRHPDAVCFAYRVGYPIWWTREIHTSVTYEEQIAEVKANPLPQPASAELTKREHRAEQARAMYEKIRGELPASAKGKFLVLELATGDYEMDEEAIRADVHLRERRPDAKHVFQFRVGYRLQAGQTPTWCEE